MPAGAADLEKRGKGCYRGVQLQTNEKAMARVTSERLVEDLRQVVRDAEELLKVTAGQAGERIAEVRERAQESLINAKARLAELGDAAATRAHEAADCTDAYVRDNPWTAVGIGAVVGVLVGLLLGRGNGNR